MGRQQKKELVRLAAAHALRKEQEEAEAQKAARSAGKTVESVFYFLSKMTVQVMVVADRRTATMIHVNAIMISAVVALLLRKIEEQRYLLLPTMVLLAVNLVVIFISIYSMRVGRNHARRAASAGPGANVFVFDPEAPVSLQQYQESMSAIALDGPRMQKAMVEQLYFSRELLKQRARALRVTYDVFIYGLAGSLAVFAFVLLRR